MELVIEAGVFAMLVMELVKMLVRQWKSDFVFTDTVYALALPILSYASVPVLALLGYTNYALPTDMVGFVQELVRVTVGALVAVLVYNNTIKISKNETK